MIVSDSGIVGFGVSCGERYTSAYINCFASAGVTGKKYLVRREVRCEAGKIKVWSSYFSIVFELKADVAWLSAIADGRGLLARNAHW